MSSSEDDEALTWAGGRDPSHYETPDTKSPTKSKVVADPSSDDDDLPPATSAAVLISLGILGGIYLLYTVGWLISWQRFAYGSDSQLELVAFHVQQLLAVVASALWFVATVLFTRARKPTVRLLWLLLGAIVLVPWSFLLGS